MNLSDIIKKPVMTEKSMKLQQSNKFAFLVDKRASKAQIRQAVEDNFKVNVVGVNTMIMPGERKLAGKRKLNKLGEATKKAVVELKKGQTIAALVTEESK